MKTKLYSIGILLFFGCCVFYSNAAALKFGSRTTISTGTAPSSELYVIDLDKDGDMDVLGLSGTLGTVAWYENDGSPQFTTHTITSSVSSPFSVYAIDMDRDSDIDVLVAATGNQAVYWYENDGSQNFTQREVSTSAGAATTVYAVDIDQDGDVDVFSGVFFGQDVWFENDGSQNFNKLSLASSSPPRLYAIDVDQDSDLDLVGTGKNAVEWLENDGSQNFSVHSSSTGFSTTEAYAIDMDGDNDIDLLASGVSETVWFENDGSQNFTKKDSIAGTLTTVGNVLDADGDGDIDLLLKLSSNTPAWFLNDGSQNFSEKSLETSTVSYLYAADLDGDSDLDVLASPSGVSLAWYENITPSVSLSVSKTAIAENAGTSVVTATLSTVSDETVIVNLSYEGTATKGTDYSAASSLTISVGSTTGTLTVAALTDTAYEGTDETIILDISSLTNAVTTTSQAQPLSITEDDPAPTVSLSVSSTAIEENAGTSVATVTLSHVRTEDVVVTLDYSSSIASWGVDFNGATSVTISAGATTATVPITTIADSISENNESIIVKIESVSGGDAQENGDQSQTLTLLDYVTPVYVLNLIPQSGSNAPFNGINVGEHYSLALIDINVDQDLDLFIGKSDGTIDFYENRGTVQFPLYDSGSSANPLSGVDVGTNADLVFVDIDADGDQDAFIGASDGTINYFKNTGTAQSPNFVEQTGTNNPLLEYGASQDSHPAFVDIDNDGDFDYFLTNGDNIGFAKNIGTPQTPVFEGQSPANNPVRNAFKNTPFVPIALEFIDLDGNGAPDFFATYSGNASAVVGLNRGTAEVPDFSIFPGGIPPYSALGDLDRDGDIDYLSGNTDGTLLFIENFTVVSLSLSHTSILENAGTSVVTAQLSNVTNADVVVNLSYSGTATTGMDFSGATSITINAGSTEGSATVTAIQDSDSEPAETIIVEISNVSGGGAIEKDTQSQTLSLIDDDDPIVSLSVSQTTLGESDSEQATVTATLNMPFTSDVTVNLAFSGNATSGTDFSVSSSSITILSGATTGTAVVTATKDLTYEATTNETLTLGISSLVNAITDTAQAHTITITEGDSAPTVSLSTSSDTLAESSGMSQVTVSLSVATTADVLIDLSVGGNAISGTDYSGGIASLSISAGSTTEAFILTGLSDSVYEGEESVTVAISGVTGGSATENAEQTQTITITESSPAPTVSLAASSTMAETSGNATITATLSTATTVDVTVGLGYGGTAISGTDYMEATSITISAGSTTGSTSLNSLSDSLYETDETIDVSITSVTGGGALESDNQLATVSLIDDELAPTVTLALSASTLSEDGGQSSVTASLSGATTVDVVVTLNYGGSAVSGTDYNISASSITINAGATSGTTTLTSQSDELYEGGETIQVSIASVSGGGASAQDSQTQTLTLNDAESVPSVTLSVSEATIAETDGTATLTATLSHASTSIVTVQLAYTGTGTKDTDYSANTSLVISAGATTGTTSLIALSDALDEEEETVIVDIESVEGATESDTQQITISVVDDDEPPSVSMVASSTTIGEADGASTFTFSLSTVSAKDITISLSLTGTADNTDYTLASSLLINAGSSIGTLVLQASQDTLSELDETVIVEIADVTNGTENGNQQQTVTFQDDDEPFVSLSVDQTTIAETDGIAQVMASLSRSFTTPVTVNFSLSGSASAEDYSIPSSLVIETGTTSQSVTLNATSDFWDEDDETVVVTIDSLINGVEGSPTEVTLTLTDDDTAGITVGAISGNTHEDGDTATFTVVLDSESTDTVSIDVSSADTSEGTASPATLTFTSANWNVAQTVTVRGIGDLEADSNVTYTIVLAAAFSNDSLYAGMDAEDVMVINEDNDIAGLILGDVKGTLKEDSETPTTVSFTIRLKTPPTADVIFDLRITDTSEGSFSKTQEEGNTSLTFTPDNWQVDRTINLFAVDDSDNDGDQAFQVVLENITSTDSNYTVEGNPSLDLNRYTLDLVTVDNDGSGLLVSSVVGQTSEDGKQTASVSVNLKTQPTTTTVVSVESSDMGEVTVAPAHLTFTPENWAALQTVQLTGVDDTEVDGAQTATITFQADSNYDNVSATASVTNDDNDAAALVVGTVNGNTKEDGTSANFTVRLATQPAEGETVIVTLSASDATEGKTDRSQLIFTRDNWNSDQTILVFGVDDDTRDGKVAYTVILNTQSSTGVGGYQGLSKDVALTNEDDEVVGVVLSEVSNPVDENGRNATFTVRLQLAPIADVTVNLISSNTEEGIVSPANLTFTPENWKADQTVTVTGVRGGIGTVDGDQSFIVQLTLTSTDADYASLAPASVTVVNQDVDKAGIVQSAVRGEPTEDGDLAEFNLSLLSAPQGNVVIDVSSSNETEGKATPAQLTFTTTNWSAPQKIVVQGQNEALGADTIDGPQQFFVNLAINQAQTADSAYDALIIASVALVNQDNDSAGFIVSDMTGAIQENGLIPQSFTVKLSSQPANDSTVTVTLRTSDSTEGRLETNTLTFTSEDWSSDHKVNLFGVDDNLVDGNQSFYVHFDQAQSADSQYQLTPASVLVVNEDDDQARVVVSDLEGTAREDGSTARFTARLGTQPSGDVIMDLTVADDSTDEVTISRSSLMFTETNWNAVQTVVVTGLADDVLDGDQTYRITVSIGSGTADANYNNLIIAPITGVNEDIDVAGFVFSETNENTSEDGTHSSFTLRLRSKPAGSVIVNLSTTDPNEAQLQTDTVTFDDKTWSANQTISVQGVDDDRQDKDQRYYVELTVADSTTDSLYRNLPVARVLFFNEDNDVSNFIVTSIDQNTREDGTAAEFKVRLSTIPEGDVTLSFQVEGSSSSTPTLSDEVSLSTASLTFTPENWKADQRVVLRGVDDDDTDGDQTYLLTFNTSQSTADANYHGKQLDLLQGINEDDDIAEFVVESLNQTISEDGTEGFFRLRLRSRPTEGSTVTVGFQATGEDTALPTLSASELEFTPTNWSSWQKVIVIGQDDNLIDGDQPFKIVFDPVISTDPNYQGVVIPAQEGVTNDNDSGGISISSLSGNVNEQRQRASFTLRLRSQPTSNVTLQMSIEKEFDTQGNEVTAEGEIIPGDKTVVFTPNNWNAEQIVRVAGINDNFQDGDQRFRVLFDSVTSEDNNYNGLVLAPLVVINEDDDISGFIITEISRPVQEDGTTATFEISLRSRPYSLSPRSGS